MVDFRLYGITGERFHPGRDLVEVMEEAIQGGVDILQLRDKTGSKRKVLEKARRLRELTRRYGIPFIVNDHLDIALVVDADGVHLGQDDLPLPEARKILGPDKIIGISTHTIQEARQAEQEGADYIGVGPVFPTDTKSDVVDPVTTAYVRAVAEEIRIPFVAIGGIKLHNVDEVLRAGATRICAVSEIVGSSDVKGTCRQFLQKIEQARETSARCN
ncbi:thiamine phosphate synthase [Marinithermofilum abyssi]|uniref:thiamine phosphate synthase n=1 Tax=Marinithermofilum abyssi TaxID=1571185 RepID=UPI00166F45D4|nr:thiamine phosphate synthase [Marinithermofilum abyssi]